MRGFRKPEQPRDQNCLWSERLEDALPPDHIVRLVDAILQSKPFAATFQDWEKQYVLVKGCPPYHPRYLAGLYLYGMMNRIRSSRQLEDACCNRIDVKWLMSGQCPDHSTIAGFVNKHSEHLKRLFRDLLKVGIDAKLVKVSHVAVDGTKIQAKASKGSLKRREAIEAEANRLADSIETEWLENEQRDTRLLGKKGGWTARRKAKETKRIKERLEQALANLEERESKSARGTKCDQASTTDPDCRLMRMKKGGSEPAYNAQIAVDAGDGLILANDVDDSPADSGQLTPMLKQVEDNVEEPVERASADSAYNTGPELKELEEMGVEGYLPDTNTKSSAKPGAGRVDAATGITLNKQGFIDSSAFDYDSAKNTFACPAGSTLRHLRRGRERMSGGVTVRHYYGKSPDCGSCRLASLCLRRGNKSRIITRDEFEPMRQRLRQRMATSEGQAIYKRRAPPVEGGFGTIKGPMNFTRFLRSGLEKVRTEWSLLCTAFNLKKLVRHPTELRRALEAYQRA